MGMTWVREKGVNEKENEIDILYMNKISYILL